MCTSLSHPPGRHASGGGGAKSPDLLSPGHPKVASFNARERPPQREPLQPFPETFRQRRGGICIIVNNFEDDDEDLGYHVDIDKDVEDDFVFEDEFSSNVGSSMTALDGNNPDGGEAGGRGGAGAAGGGADRKVLVGRKSMRNRAAAAGQRGQQQPERMPLIRKLFSLARDSGGQGGQRRNTSRSRSGLNGQMEMDRNCRQSRNENTLASGKKGWSHAFYRSLVSLGPFSSLSASIQLLVPRRCHRRRCFSSVEWVVVS